MSEPCRILVTGGNGVVGMALKAIQNDFGGYEFVFSSSSVCNLCRMDEVIRYVADVKPTHVLHTAAVSGGIGLSMSSPATVLRDNVLMNFSVLEAARAQKVQKVVMTLSTGMYPVDAPNPIKEEYIHNGPAHPSNYSYAYAKRLVEPMIRAYRQEYGMCVVGVVPNGIYGEHDCFNYDDATVLASLVRRFSEHRHDGEPIVIWGDGRPLREFTYAQDIARAYMWVLEHYDAPEVLHIGTTEEHSIGEIARMIAEEAGVNVTRLMFDTSKPSGQLRKSTDNSRFVGLSGFTYTPLKEGLRRTVRWFCEAFDHDPRSIRMARKVRRTGDKGVGA